MPQITGSNKSPLKPEITLEELDLQKKTDEEDKNNFASANENKANNKHYKKNKEILLSSSKPKHVRIPKELKRPLEKFAMKAIGLPAIRRKESMAEAVSEGVKYQKGPTEITFDKAYVVKDDPFEAACMRREERKKDDNLFIADYLYKNCKFFNRMNIHLVSFLGSKISARKFKPDEVIMKIGDEGDCMYCIYSGAVQVIPIGYTGPAIMLESNEVFGQTALYNKTTRNATVIAKTPVKCFTLFKVDYDNVVFQSKKVQKQKNLQFLKAIKYFYPWSSENLIEFNDYLDIRQLKKDEILEEIIGLEKQNHTIFFIVLSGLLYMETKIRVKEEMRYPIGLKEWETKTITKDIFYRVNEYGPGCIFAHETSPNDPKHYTKIYAYKDSEIFYLNPSSNCFFKFFKPLDKNADCLLKDENAKYNRSGQYSLEPLDDIAKIDFEH